MNSYNLQQYQADYKKSITNPEEYWAEQAKQYISWVKPWDKVLNYNFPKGEADWFIGAQLNACYNCIDRHLSENADKVAFIWESDEPNQHKKFTYQDIYLAVCRFANVLKSHNIKKGDCVCIYMPMIPEAIFAMLACARIGAVHSVVFGGFSPASLQNRIIDANCKLVITADEGVRGSKIVPLKQNVDEALEQCPNVETVIVIKRTNNQINWDPKRDHWYFDAIEKVDNECAPEIMNSDDPLFILYTSGSTGKPKGILHTHGGYLLYAAITFKTIFAYKPEDIYWCSADVGWITGHTYMVYGPMINAATSVIFEGVPTYPNPSRFWNIIDTHKVNIFYTAPTAIRALMKEGDAAVQSTSRESLRVLGTVGEPINPEAWRWYYDIVGNSNCPIVDTWWQTETGGAMISPIAGVTELKPGSATFPFFGVEPALIDDNGKEISGKGSGELVIKKPWPGIMKTVYGDSERHLKTYFSDHPGYFTTGDNAKRDEDGYYWITGRADDVINVSGHRLGTAEIESALITHESVAEAAVVGMPHEVKGQGIYAFVTLKKGFSPSDDLKTALVNCVKENIGSIAKPDKIHWASQLPKTRSGKIMRRVLRKIVNNQLDELGDLSTLADPKVIDDLLSE